MSDPWICTCFPVPLIFLKADYGMQMKIMNTLRELNTVISTSHVKGHKDDALLTSSKKYLSYEARLNIKADLLATCMGMTETLYCWTRTHALPIIAMLSLH
eukprot:scaffold13219_cov61-Attheya_sp.AAC.2